MLYRAGDVLQEIFYIYREKLNIQRLGRIEKEGSKLYVHLKDPTEEELNTLLTEESIMRPFPRGLCETEEDKKAILVHRACLYALAFMHDIANYMLAGMNLLS